MNIDLNQLTDQELADICELHDDPDEYLVDVLIKQLAPIFNEAEGCEMDDLDRLDRIQNLLN